MFRNHASILLLASSLLLLPVAATAADKGTTPTASKGGAVTADSLMERYGNLAGSPDNAKSLVHGLRAKEEVVLVGPAVMPNVCRFPCRGGATTTSTVTVRFMPTTDAMGWGNIDIALALAEADLKTKYVDAPKPEHVKFALMGGSLMTPSGSMNFDGILKMRAEGQGWGEIAKSLGFELK